MSTESKEPSSYPPPCREGVVIPRMNNFITQIIDEDMAKGMCKYIVTRFPPEPNGWLHIGHAKSICLNFGLAQQYGGRCHLRFDDTNPVVEEDEYIEAIKEDVKWLGFDWHDKLFFASDYFDQLYQWAVDLIRKGLAYVDEQSEEELKVNRGSLKEPGIDSPYRNRPIEENMTMFERMKNGDFPEGHCVLRAKIDMAHGNLNMRDPPIYRIKHASHPRTGNRWCIYPIYDFAHGQSDSIEGITHSICTLEFYDHRLLYDWFQEKLGILRTKQIEFARLNLTHTVTSKRRLLKLVNEKLVNGWSDPRMPTLAACRRRGYPACAIRDIMYNIGVAKRDQTIEMNRLENCVRNHLHASPRRMAILDPIRVTLTNWPEDKEPETTSLPNHPEMPEKGFRQVAFEKHLYIERSDFMKQPSPKYFRLSPGAEVRLQGAYWITCQDLKEDENGKVTELFCTYDPSTKGGNAPSSPRKVKGVVHWLAESNATPAEIRMYETLFSKADPDECETGKTWIDNLNPHSLRIMKDSKVESSLRDVNAGESFQFVRTGYFTADTDTSEQRPVFNLTVTLEDSFSEAESKVVKAKEQAKAAREKAAEERRQKKENKAQRLLLKQEKETKGNLSSD